MFKKRIVDKYERYAIVKLKNGKEILIIYNEIIEEIGPIRIVRADEFRCSEKNEPEIERKPCLQNV